MAATTNTPGYPATYGTSSVREAAAGWLRRRHGVAGADPANVLPIIGAKEFVAWLPTLLGLGADDTVGIPALAYPTYDVGARLAGAQPMVVDGTVAVGPGPLAMLWVNSPANPHGQVLGVEHLRKVVAWARDRGTIVVSDECYIEFGWDDEVPALSILHPDVCGSSHAGLLAVHSLSKRSNLAGYRAGFVTGDGELIAELLEVRKHAGMIVPAPVQGAMVAALDDDAHVDEQRARYLARRAILWPALVSAGFSVEHSRGRAVLVGHSRRGLLGEHRMARAAWDSCGSWHLLRPGRTPACARRTDRDRRARQGSRSSAHRSRPGLVRPPRSAGLEVCG